MKPIDILLNAQKNKDIVVNFEIIAGGEKIPAMLTPFDYNLIQEEQRKVHDLKLSELIEEGLDEKKVIEKRWKQKLAGLDAKTKKVMEAEKPDNLAEQLAMDFSQNQTLLYIIPRFVKNPDGSLMFPEPKDRESLRELLSTDFTLLQTFMNAYTGLVQKIAEVNDTVKNSLPQEN